MTDLRTAAQQALEALEVATNCLDGYYIPRGKTTLPEIEDAITALKAALAEPVQEPVKQCMAHGECFGGECIYQRPAEPVQEPVAWLFTNLQSGDYDFCYQEDEHDHDREMWHKQPLYTAPPQRPAEPLTEGKP